jgi:predicted DNA-binding protein (MmcQ/YjbR family)
MSSAKANPGLASLTRICLHLPEAVVETHGDHADFRVRKKVFAYYLNNHHGDGITSVCCKTSLGENIDRANADPTHYYLPAYIGSRGWVGFRLDQSPIDWRMVKNLVELSYCLAAPKRLAELVRSSM